VIDVTPLADSIRQEVRQYTQQHNHLQLVGILAEVGPFRHDAELYSERIQETLQEDGIQYQLWRCQGHQQQQLESVIRQANENSNVHGIVVFYPIYPPSIPGPYKNRLTGVYYKTQDDYVRNVVDPAKDVEGICGTKWYHAPQLKQPRLVYPCTAMSVQQILEHYHSKDWQDQVVSVVNRSEILGRPLAAMLAAAGATVYSIDADSILRFRPDGRSHRCSSNLKLQDCLAESSVVVTGVPHADFDIPTNFLAEGTTVVNVSEFTNVCEETLLAHRPDIKYIPQVGKVTVAVLEQNLVRLHQRSLADADS
jgi:methylenetetrahydrofolate dehydrogenase (NAD+)